MTGLPDFERVLADYDENKEIQRFARHNLTVWRDIHGALPLALEHRLEFDPRPDYWYQTERRFLVAYFAKRFGCRYAPAEALRRLAFRTFRHFDLARQEGRLGPQSLAARYEGGWPALADLIREVGSEMPDISDYERLRAVWRRFKAASIREDLLVYLSEFGESDDLADFEPAFFRRLPWFPYLGLSHLDELRPRQIFFGAFYTVFTSVNSYKVGGGMNYAPILQNNPAGVLLDFASRWAKGEAPNETGFLVYSKGREDRQDRAHYMPAIELFGFLNLHIAPFYNGAAAAYATLAEPGDTSVLSCVRRVGERTRTFLTAKPQLVERLATAFRAAIRELEPPAEIPMEGISGRRSAEQHPDDARDQVDLILSARLRQVAWEKADKLSDKDAAATYFHLMLDATTYRQHRSEAVTPGSTPPAPVKPIGEQVEADGPDSAAPGTATVALAPALARIANDALAILRGGFHVMLAGVPGTGKTTVAQLVGHAWNGGHEQVQNEVSLDDAPTTAVANSAWAPFHTIGGILPDTNGRFRAQRGVFIDPDWEEQGSWRLRGECIVLDEMNRADLDRCVGELYPLLSHSVDWARPAGIPGVVRICANPRFRIVATVNDSTIDDVVFPISEGLSRRFVRLELNGATKSDVLGYLDEGQDAASRARYHEAATVVSDFFDACEPVGKLTESELGDHLPFGVGYFGLLQAWVSGRLRMSAMFCERDLRDQALQILRIALRSATKDRGYEPVFAELVLSGNVG